MNHVNNSATFEIFGNAVYMQLKHVSNNAKSLCLQFKNQLFGMWLMGDTVANAKWCLSAYDDGSKAYLENVYSNNPYNENTDNAMYWDLGFKEMRSHVILSNDMEKSEKHIAKFEKWVSIGAPNGII